MHRCKSGVFVMFKNVLIGVSGNVLNNKLTSIVNEHNKYASLALKWYSPVELGITNNDDMCRCSKQNTEKLIVELWISDDSLFGRNIRKELSNLYQDFFGYLTVRWTVDLQNCHFEAFAYKSGE